MMMLIDWAAVPGFVIVIGGIVGIAVFALCLKFT